MGLGGPGRGLRRPKAVLGGSLMVEDSPVLPLGAGPKMPGHLLSPPGQGWPQGSAHPEEGESGILEAPLVERLSLPSREGGRLGPRLPGRGDKKKRPRWIWKRGHEAQA